MQVSPPRDPRLQQHRCTGVCVAVTLYSGHQHSHSSQAATSLTDNLGFLLLLLPATYESNKDYTHKQVDKNFIDDGMGASFPAFVCNADTSF